MEEAVELDSLRMELSRQLEESLGVLTLLFLHITMNDNA